VSEYVVSLKGSFRLILKVIVMIFSNCQKFNLIKYV
jgi:hypothetical protein